MADTDLTLQLRDNAQVQLAKIKDVETGVDYLNKVSAMEVWIKAEKKDSKLQNMVAAQKIRVQRILGKLVREGQEAGEIASHETARLVSSSRETLDPIKTLSDIGLTKKQSHTFKLIESIPEEQFEETLAEASEEVAEITKNITLELTTAAMVRIARGNERAKFQETQTKELPRDKYSVILADPPWRYDFSTTTSREIENQYPTMSLGEIMALPVESTADDDSVLFLWATSPKLIEALQVMEAWGFTYVTCAVWDKEKIGMGYYFRQQHEILLVGKKGNLPVPLPESRPSSVIREARTEHSKKPEKAYELLIKMYPNEKRRELFAREKHDGFEPWGNEC